MKKTLDKFDDYLTDHYDTNPLCRVTIRILEIPEYFKYLFAKADNPRWCSDNRLIDWWKRLKCRIKHHPCGCIYYSSKDEPDTRCIECGDEIG